MASIFELFAAERLRQAIPHEDFAVARRMRERFEGGPDFSPVFGTGLDLAQMFARNHDDRLGLNPAIRRVIIHREAEAEAERAAAGQAGEFVFADQLLEPLELFIRQLAFFGRERSVRDVAA